MSLPLHIRIAEEEFSPNQEQSELEKNYPDAGAIATFTGLVRNHNEGEPVTRLTLEHYPGMTEKVLRSIAASADERWPLLAVSIIHRVGEMAIGDRIVWVGVASAHRQDAFDACHYIMDRLKTDAPFWKKEVTATGARWIEAKDQDREARLKWDK